MSVAVAAATGFLLFLQSTTKRNRFPSFTNNKNVLVSRLKDIVCFSCQRGVTRSIYYSTNLPQHKKIKRKKSREEEETTREQKHNFFNSNNNTLLNQNMASKKRVCIVGSGNWGSAIAKIAGKNVQGLQDQFENKVNMYVYEEVIDGKNLTEIINTTHENVKYLPGIKLPENVIAVPDVVEATANADILVFVLPHQFIKGICKTIKGKVKPEAIAVSLIKGFDCSDGKIRLLSDIISESLGIECAVLMGANLAHEVASEEFCECTIGATKKESGSLLKKLFDADYFRCSVVTDAHTVEACGALKNIVAVGSGITDGLKFGDNTKAAVLRLGMMEIIEFINIFFKGSQLRTFFESSGLADLVTTCYGGRNRKLGEALVKTDKTVAQLEQDILNGQSFQGPPTAKEVFEALKERNLLDRCPLFVAVHRICQREMEPKQFISLLKNHPEHKNK